MTFASLFADWQVIALLLMAGYLLREFCPPLQKLFLPSSVIGGAIGLIGGQQVLGLWEVPKSFSSYSGSLIVLIMACLVWGVKIDSERVKGYFDYYCMLMLVRFGQIALGALTGIGLRLIWTELPLGWGTMAQSAYYGGHGTVATYGGVFESLGFGTDYNGLGMIMATMGLLCAVIVGMIIVNIGVRKGWATFVSADSATGNYEERRLLPKDKRSSIGTMKVPSGSINPLAFQFAMLMSLIWIGKNLINLLGTYVWAPFGSMPNVTYGILAAVIIWPLMRKFGLEDYVDRKTCSNISGFCLEVLITGSLATLNLQLLSKFFVPLLIQFVIITLFTAWACLWYNRKISVNQWFEKGVFVFGQSTGATPTGLALVRAVDPDSVSIAGEAHGVASGIGTIWFWLPALLPVLATTMPWAEVALGLGLALAFGVGGWVLFRKNVKALGR